MDEPEIKIAQLVWAYSSCCQQTCHGSRRKTRSSTLPWGKWDLEDSGLNFLGRKRRHQRSAQCWWRGSQKPHHGDDGFRPKVVCPHYTRMCKPTDSSPRGWRRHRQLWLFCAILAPGWMRAGVPQGNGLIICVWKPGEGESIPSGRTKPWG